MKIDEYSIYENDLLSLTTTDKKLAAVDVDELAVVKMTFLLNFRW